MKPSSSRSRRIYAHSLSSCWGTSTTLTSAVKVAQRTRQSRRFLEFIEDNFLSQVMDSPTRGDAILDLISDASELISDVKTGGSLGCSDHALVEFIVLRDIGKARSIVRTLNCRKANCSSSRSLAVGHPGKRSSGTREKNRAGRSLRTLTVDHKSSQSPGVRN